MGERSELAFSDVPSAFASQGGEAGRSRKEPNGVNRDMGCSVWELGGMMILLVWRVCGK